MPVQACQTEGKPGFKWGEQGKCFLYERNDPESKERARARAAAQGQAIKAAGGE